MTAELELEETKLSCAAYGMWIIIRFTRLAFLFFLMVFRKNMWRKDVFGW
jgi:hypothetical protein